MTRNAIEITGLRKTYAAQGNQPPKEALKGIDLSIPAGSIFGLLGPNGAGKSTLINILAGLVLKSAGNVKIWGFDQDVNPRQSRASIGVMPQELNMDPFFTARGSLDVQAGLYGVPKSQRKTNEILEMIGLTDKADAYARALSGGMRRRLLLGKALVHSPQVLVLDEPTAGVDIELRQMLWRNVRRLNEQGMTIILTTHYLEEAQEMCDEIAIINHGELIVRDTTEALLGRLDAKTLVITPEQDLTGPLPDIPDVEVSTRADGSLAFDYRKSDTSPRRILDALYQAGISIDDVKTEEPDLEDVFLALTHGAHTGGTAKAAG
ncbi:ABC transporter ATP-binding protein [Qingshengfaniella alkalisoli]|uniref:ABC transporter ATP-binding protein n=1 Tax=Qingshengfaniella alkalisoli TaxID=2599296 RepID=A0A5B8IYJ5_9RHOB|nr:ABC transporter ATP-binding protein [Qingshengfaniella alkalisoli]QDY69728.1 ABC transporter ATP-binding protein [Qingshengfaniella alkalisoli]